MKVKALLWLLLFFWAIGGYAGEVTKSEAKIVALNWLNGYSSQFFEAKDISRIDILEENEDAFMYLVSFSPKGWVMVSGVDKTEPVLGYSDSSVFDTKKMPVQLKGWLNGLEKELRKAASDDYVPSKDTEDRWRYFKSDNLDIQELKSLQATSAGPLLSTTWDQGQYYNEMAPFDVNSSAGNNHVWIGCVATAMAQVMKYWEYPVSGSGSKSYNHPDYGTQSADFGNATYNWSAMPDNLTSQNTDVQEINYHAAVAVEMNFSPSGSGAYLGDAVDAFTKYFKYNSTLLWVDKNEWDSEAEWKEVLKSEIDNGRPVIYSGYNSTLSSGHAFVCDGYSSGDYFHFNWGWGGSANGNFLLSSLTPGNGDYTTSQSAIFGIEPIRTASINFPYVNGFESGGGAFSLFGNSSVSVAESHNGTYGLQLSEEGFSGKSLNVANLTFVVPANAVLDFWVKRYTERVSANNLQKVALYPVNGTEPLIEIFNGDGFNDADWVNFNTDLSAYEGQSVRLMFVQQNFDPGAEQWMYIDDVAITGGNGNLPPYKPGSPDPDDNEVSVEQSPVLKWTGGDPNGDDVRYLVYIDTDTNLPFYKSTYDTRMKIPDLEPKTKYYWKVKASDEKSVVVSDVWSFTTRGLPPEVETCGLVSVTPESAVICAQIIDNNGSEVKSRGIWWDNLPDPQMSDNELISDDVSDAYEVEIKGLEPYETYYVKPFAQSEEGYGVGSEFEFRTVADVPAVTYVKIDDIKRNSAVFTGFVPDINDSIITRRGVFWSVHDKFDVDSAAVKSETGSWDVGGEFELLVDSMPGPDTIYFRMFAENSAGIAYSEQHFFATQNRLPVVDLDADNNSGRSGFNYEFSLVEQNEGGKIADDDVKINDADGDIMQQIVVTLETQVHDEKEYLVYTGDSVLISVYGRSTDSLVVEYDGADSNLFWDSIIQNIEYRNISDAPVADSVREINIVVNDGFSYSLGALTFVTMIPENDAPVSLRSPSLSSLPQYNHYLSEIEHGIWSDTLDNISDVEFEYTYTMEADMGDTIISIASPADSFFVDERFCGSCLRVVETVIDKSSGGENEANAKAYSNWYDVRKIEQEVIEFYLEDSYEIIPKVEYRHEPYRFSGSATSGLPLRYGIFNDDFFSITNDSLSVKDIGMEPVYAYQPGNNCYSKTDSLYKNINVVKGSQQILADMDSVYHFGVDSFKVNVSVASGLNVFVESMDTSIIKISNQHAIVMGTGQCFLRFTQPGNKYYKAADTLRYLINVNKGNQFINAPDSIVKNYNDSLFDLSVTANSNLKVDYVVPENEVLSYQDQQFKITGTGVTNIIINQEGNENWEATSDTVHCVIKKGLQEILFDSIEFVFYDDEMLLLDAESTSGLEVTYEVSDNDIADIHGDTLLIRAAGELTVNASQAGNEFWMPATLVSRELNIQKAGQTITTTLSDSITTRQKISYGDFHASSGLTDFVIESSNDDVILVLEDSIIVNDRGRITLHVTQPGNNNYLPASEDFVFEVLYPLNVEKFGTHTLDLFPNPADDKLHIVIDGNILLPLDFSLINLVGQVQMTDKIINQFQVVDIENIESGTYIVLLRNDDHYLTQKIIVK